MEYATGRNWQVRIAGQSARSWNRSVAGDANDVSRHLDTVCNQAVARGERVGEVVLDAAPFNIVLEARP